MKIELKKWLSSEVIFTHDAEENSIKLTLEAGVSAKIDLTGAYLTGAYLRGAYLTGAYLTGAYLRGADLRGADLTGADLTGAYLRGADLRGADLRGADLRGAYLRGAEYRDIKLNNPPIQILNLRYPILIFETHMEIGCKFHTHKKWEDFSDKEIISMDGKDALKFWQESKAALMEFCKIMASGKGEAKP